MAAHQIQMKLFDGQGGMQLCTIDSRARSFYESHGWVLVEPFPSTAKAPAVTTSKEARKPNLVKPPQAR